MKRVRCSSLPRLDLCAGSLKAEEGLSSESTEISKSGDRIHIALEAYFRQIPFDLARLNDRELLVYEWFKAEAERLIAKHGGADRISAEVALVDEIVAGRIELSGHIDLLVFCNDGTILVIDWKTGQGEVEIAKRNKQALGYAWLVGKSYDVEPSRSVLAFIFSAGNDEGERFTGVEYNGNYLRGSGQARLVTICKNALDPKAKRTPDVVACKYCDACSTDNCPESVEDCRQIATGLELIETKPPSLPADTDVVKAVFEAVKRVESFARKFKPMLVAAVLADPDKYSAFEMVAGKQRRSITDLKAAFARLVEVGEYIDGDAFSRCLELKFTAIEAEMKAPLKADGLMVKDQREFIEGVLGDALEIKRDNPSVRLRKAGA